MMGTKNKQNNIKTVGQRLLPTNDHTKNSKKCIICQKDKWKHTTKSANVPLVSIDILKSPLFACL